MRKWEAGALADSTLGRTPFANNLPFMHTGNDATTRPTYPTTAYAVGISKEDINVQVWWPVGESVLL